MSIQGKGANLRKCGHLKINESNNRYNFFSGLLLLILPKCPFCIMAYTSTVMLCSKDAVFETQQHHISILSVCLTAFFCLVVIAGLVLNFRGDRTKYALALSLLGILVILNSVIRNGGQELYYFGVLILFIAIWLNGSLISILRKFKNTFSVTKRNVAGSP